MTECPEGWAPADGTNGTPDLRGYFIRGRDNVGTGAAGNDPSGSRAIGNLQSDAFQGHWHDSTGYTSNAGGFRGFSNATDYTGAGPTSNTIDNVLSAKSDGSNGTPRTSSETRPKNVALTYCMRKN